MRELKSDRLIIVLTSRSLQFQTQLIKLDRHETNRHIPVKRLRIGPALDAVFIRHLLIHAKKGIQLIIVDMAILERTRIHIVVNAIKNLRPFPLMCLH